MSEKYILGIDLGTTNTCAAVIKNNNPLVIINSEGERTTPSVVSFSGNSLLVGRPAKNVILSDPEDTVSSIKRSMGSRKLFRLGNEDLYPEAISSLILKKIKTDAEAFLGTEIKDAVITVPAYFDDVQRQATIDAGKMAGLNVRRILNEPSAAALAYGLPKENVNKKVLVFDFGGGTLDVSIIAIADNEVTVLSTSGINDLGGDDIDNAIVELLITDFYQKERVNLKEDITAVSRLKEAAEKAKVALTASRECDINIPCITNIDGRVANINYHLTREKFDSLIAPILTNIQLPIKTALEDAKLSPEEIDNIILVGGTTRVPYIQKKIEEVIGRKPEKVLNPDESVAIGAAIQGSIIAGSSDLIFSDITSLSLSIRTASEMVKVLIPRGTQIPCSVSETFSTSSDGQTDVVIECFQGERSFYFDNKKIGKFVLENLPARDKGLVKITVTFDIDENGVLSVSAKDIDDNISGNIKITDYLKLSPKEVEKMINTLEFFKEKDIKRVKIINAKYEAKDLINHLENISNSDLSLNDDELRKIDNYLLIEKSFLEKSESDINEENLVGFADANLIIKSFIIDLESRKEEE